VQKVDSVFDNLEVVDLSTGIAGPMAAMFLRDFGARVTKVEPPDGDPGRDEPGFSMYNRGKLGLVIDPESQADVVRLRNLLGVADVCITNGLDSLRSYGLSSAELVAMNPRLVIGEATGGGHDLAWPGGGERHSLLAAVTGVAMRQSSNDGGPVEFVTPHTLYLQGVWLATCVVAALVEREGSGRGQMVTVSGVDAAMLVNAMDLAADPSAASAAPAPAGSGGLHPTYAPYQAGDGRWFLVGALHARMAVRLINALGVDNGSDSGSRTFEDLLLPENRVLLRKRIESVLSTRSRQEWMEFFDEIGVPCGPTLDQDEWLNHPHLAAIGLREEIVESGRGRVTMPGIPIRMDKTPGRIAGPAPTLGQHSSSVVFRPAVTGTTREVPVNADADRQGESGGPLSGLRVLNPGAFIAGPVVGFLLAELGADVIKVESPEGDPFRMTAFTYNRGMRSVALDLKQPDGQRVFHQLVAMSDVVIDNARADASKRLTTDYEALAATNPDVVAVTISAFGDDGPLANKTGFDAVLGSYSGMMAAQGGADDPVMLSLPFVDVTTGALGALGACLGVYARLRGGPGQRVRTSLAASSLIAQAGELVRYEGSPPPPRGGTDFRGAEPGDRYYQVRDGWVRVGPRIPTSGRGESLAESAVAAALLGRGAQDDLAGEASIRQALARMTAEEALRVLDSDRVAVVAVRSGADLVRDDRLRSSGLIQTQLRHDDRVYVMPGQAVTFSRTPRHGVLVSPGVGEHTRSVLEYIGLTSAQTDDLLERKVAVLGAPFDPVFLPRYR
jgi:crotonobetainyl-CoA:carnitine CoA-transferase CaiB-like acyl-CoA transferase